MRLFLTSHTSYHFASVLHACPGSKSAQIVEKLHAGLVSVSRCFTADSQTKESLALQNLVHTKSHGTVSGVDSEFIEN